MVEPSYSRNFEREADDFSFDYLDRQGIPTGSFVGILVRMENQASTAAAVPGFLSSHPASP